MSQSYVPQGAYIICTEMKSPAPVQLYYSRNRITVINFDNDKSPLLTKEDKKLSNQFTCNINSKFWGGLKMICAIVAVGALVIATVATGGLILVIAATAVLGMGVATYKEVAHDCDVTMESKWLNYHDTVRFDQSPPSAPYLVVSGVPASFNALIKSSNMLCNKGGALSIMLDKEAADAAAQKISQLNMKEYQAHLDSQFIQTTLMLLSTKGDPVTLAVAAPLTIFNYVTGEADKEQTRKNNMEKIINGEEPATEGFLDKVTGGVSTSVRDAFIGAATDPKVIQNGIKPSAMVLWEMGKYTAVAVVNNTPGAYIRLNNTMMLTAGKEGFKKVGGSLLEGFAWGMAGAAVDAGYDVYEDQLHEEAYLEAFSARDNEEKSLTIIAGDK